jgi:hypothetical protein
MTRAFRIVTPSPPAGRGSGLLMSSCRCPDLRGISTLVLSRAKNLEVQPASSERCHVHNYTIGSRLVRGDFDSLADSLAQDDDMGTEQRAGRPHHQCPRAQGDMGTGQRVAPIGPVRVLAVSIGTDTDTRGVDASAGGMYTFGLENESQYLNYPWRTRPQPAPYSPQRESARRRLASQQKTGVSYEF